MEDIENKEQLLIQHLKTAGLRQNREISFLNEIFELRKDRRRLFTSLQDKCGTLERFNFDLNDQINKLKIEMAQDLNRMQHEYKCEIAKRDEQFDLLTKSLREEAELKSQNSNLLENSKIDQIKQSYEKKLSLVEEKLREIMAEQQGAELRQTRQLANQIAHKVTGEIEAKYRKKILEYKESMNSIASREKHLQSVNNTLNEQVQQLNADKKELSSQLKQMQADVQTLLKAEQVLEANHGTLLIDNEMLKRDLEECRRQIEVMKAEHATGLSKVDEKVRKIVENQKNEVKLLQESLKKEKRKVMTLEETLNDLQNELLS